MHETQVVYLTTQQTATMAREFEGESISITQMALLGGPESISGWIDVKVIGSTSDQRRAIIDNIGAIRTADEVRALLAEEAS